MTDEQLQAIRKAIEEHTAEMCADPRKAREYFYSGLGTHNRDGSICEQYGGEYTDPDHPVHSKDPPNAR